MNEFQLHYDNERSQTQKAIHYMICYVTFRKGIDQWLPEI